MARNRHRTRLVAEAKAKGLCRPPPKPGGAERHQQHQVIIRSTCTQSMCAELGCRWSETTKSRIGSAWSVDAQLARRAAEHHSAIADLQCQLASTQIAAERNAEDAALAAQQKRLRLQSRRLRRQNRHRYATQNTAKPCTVRSPQSRISQHQRWRKRRRQCGRWMSTSAKEPQYLASCLHRQRRCVMLTVSGTVQCTIRLSI